jgi:ribosomal protein L37AE/L43A
MSTTPVCPICGKPIHDNAYICRPCGQTLTTALHHIADLHAELDVTLTRQARIGSTNGPAQPPEVDPDPQPKNVILWGVAVQPLPFHLGASKVAQDVGNTISTWARVILEERRMDLPAIPEPPIGPVCNPTECKHQSCTVIRWHVRDSEITHAAKFIAEYVWWLRRRPEATEAYSDLVAVASQLERIIDNPPTLKYAGPCNVCRKDLYVREGAGVVECRPCGMTYDMAGRREWLLEAAEDRLERAAHIAQAVTDLGSPITAHRIRMWAQRGRLLPHATDGLGRPLYRIGDVRELLKTDAARDAHRHVSA